MLKSVGKERRIAEIAPSQPVRSLRNAVSDIKKRSYQVRTIFGCPPSAPASKRASGHLDIRGALKSGVDASAPKCSVGQHDAHCQPELTPATLRAELRCSERSAKGSQNRLPLRALRVRERPRSSRSSHLSFARPQPGSQRPDYSHRLVYSTTAATGHPQPSTTSLVAKHPPARPPARSIW